jgi:hypothetical protein
LLPLNLTPNIFSVALSLSSCLVTCACPLLWRKQELQLRDPVLQQHAALLGGPNATSCPVCHKVFLGAEALMEHMKTTHKDPNASGIASKLLNYYLTTFFAWQ